MGTPYKEIPGYLKARLPFEGNSVTATTGMVDGDKLATRGNLEQTHYGPDSFKGKTFRYVVWSYSTPIAGVTRGGEVVIPDLYYSSTTSRGQNLCRAYL